MKVDFKQGAWSMDALTPAYSCRFQATPQFLQREDCIENPPEVTSKDGYSYISLMTKEKVTPKVKITTHCSFRGDAAPLFVLAKDLYEADGAMRYSNYLEIVLYKGGINVWDLWTTEDGVTKWHKVMGLYTPVTEDQIHTLSAEITENRFYITLNETRVELLLERIYPQFHLGITGCEGVCRFYDMEIEQL